MRRKESLGHFESKIRSDGAKERNQLVDKYKGQLAKERAGAEKEKQNLTTMSKLNLRKQTKRLGKQINLIQEQNQQQISEIQRNAGLEKSKFIKDTEKRLSKEKIELANNLRKDYSVIYGKFEGQINDYNLKSKLQS